MTSVLGFGCKPRIILIIMCISSYIVIIMTVHLVREFANSVLTPVALTRRECRLEMLRSST